MKTFIVLLLMLMPTFAQSPDEVTPLLKQGETLARAGQLTQAQDFYENALHRFPRNPYLLYDLGNVFALQHNWPKAIENYQNSLLSMPNQVLPLFYMAQAYYMNSDLKLARETIARAAALAPDNPDVCQKYGEYLAETRETRKVGLQWLEKARSLKPSLEQIDFDIAAAQFDLGDFQGAAAGFEVALKKDPANGKAAFFLAESWSMLSDWKRARDNYDYALSHGYSSSLAYYGLGRSLVQLGSYEAALTPLQHALELNPSLKEAHFQLAQAYRQLGRLDDAQREAKLYRELSAAESTQSHDEVASLLNQGEALAHAGRLVEAQDLYEKALQKFPGNPYLSSDLGMVFFLQHNWPKAIENYQNSLLSMPNQVDPLFYLAQAYYLNSDLKLARETIARAAALAPDNPDVCQEYGEYLAETGETRKEGLQWLEKARRLKPSLERIDFDIALAQFNLNDLQDAAAGFEVALKKDPANGEAAFFLGESWSVLGDWKKARDNYDYALSHGYSSSLAYYGLGRSLVQLGSYEAALTPLQHALELNPSLKEAHFQLAQAYRQLGRLDDAQREAKLYGELSPAEGKVSSFSPKGTDEEKPTLAYVKSLLAANKEQEALDYLTKQQSKFPAENQNPHYLLGILYHSMGRNDDAKRVLDIARAQEPKNVQILVYLAVVLVSLDELGQAEEYLDSTLALDPANEFALISLAGVRYRQQRWEDVIMYLQRSHTANPGALYMLCDAYFKVGKPQQAIRTAETIRALATTNKSLLDDLNRLVYQYQADQQVSAPK